MFRLSYCHKLFKSNNVQRCLKRGTGDHHLGYDHYHPDIKELMRCRQEKEVYLVLVDDKMVNPCWDLPKIVIVGAGIAGLSAAQALVAAGFSDVTVLEASDGPGGRILSYEMRSFPIDLGATHIEGATPMNAAYNLACQEGLLKNSLIASNPFMGTFMTSSGVVLPASIESAVHYTFDNIDRDAINFFRNKVECDITLWEYFVRRIDEESVVFPELYRGLAIRALYGRLNELRSYWGDDLIKMPLDQYGAFKKVAGCNVRIPSGMIGIVGPLIRDLPDHSVKYCKPVKMIKWSTKRNECTDTDPGNRSKKKGKEKEKDCRAATVVCADGSLYPADYVIVTCSLGYLKKHHETFFVPALPNEKKDAINKLGWGHLCNIYLLYNEPFWVWKEGVVRLAWSLDELTNKSGWLTGVGSISEVLSSVQMLMVKVAGKEAQQAEELSVDRLADDLTRLIRCFTGDPTLPYPFLVLPSKWSSNEYICGGKSYIAVGSTYTDVCNLADPCPSCNTETPVILFAGDATSHHSFGTVHGARLSGIREADRIIKLTHRFQGKPFETFSPACGPPLDECCICN